MRIVKNKRSGLSFLEMIIVIAVIGVLVSLLLPGIQAIRSSVARIECQNHLKQIALATLQFEQANGTLPQGIIGNLDLIYPLIYSTPSRSALGVPIHGNQEKRDPLSGLLWLVHLLPYIEQEGVWNRVISDCQEMPLRYLGQPHRGLKTLIRTYTCPADGRLGTIHRVTSPHLEGTLVASTSYLGVSGTGPLLYSDGVLFAFSRIRIADILDGTSSTLLIGERPPSPDFAYGWWYVFSNENQGAGVLAIPNNTSRISIWEPGYYCPAGTYPFRAGKLTEICDSLHYWSLHSGGANFAFCDGSVRFLPYTVSDKLSALATRAGGEIAGQLD